MEESSATQKEISKRMDNFAVCEKQQQSSKETDQLFYITSFHALQSRYVY